MGQVIQNFCERFDKLYNYRAFAHWFVGEGLESGELSCAREEWEGLMKDYKETVEYDTAVERQGDGLEEY